MINITVRFAGISLKIKIILYSGHFSLYFRDLIKVLKWYVDRITEAERQEHIQEVLKVTAMLLRIDSV
jgi:hypothetical protein